MAGRPQFQQRRKGVDQRRKVVIDDLKQQIHQLQRRLDQFVIDELKEQIQQLQQHLQLIENQSIHSVDQTGLFHEGMGFYCFTSEIPTFDNDGSYGESYDDPFDKLEPIWDNYNYSDLSDSFDEIENINDFQHNDKSHQLVYHDEIRFIQPQINWDKPPIFDDDAEFEESKPEGLIFEDCFYESHVYFSKRISPTFLFLQKLILSSYISSYWCDWMDKITKVGKFRVHRLSFRIPSQGKFPHRYHKDKSIETRGRVVFQPGEFDTGVSIYMTQDQGAKSFQILTLIVEHLIFFEGQFGDFITFDFG